MAAFIGFVVFCYDPPYVPPLLLLLLLLQAFHLVATKAAPEQASILHRTMLQVEFFKKVII